MLVLYYNNLFGDDICLLHYHFLFFSFLHRHGIDPFTVFSRLTIYTDFLSTLPLPVYQVMKGTTYISILVPSRTP